MVSDFLLNVKKKIGAMADPETLDDDQGNHSWDDVHATDHVPLYSYPYN